VLNFCHTYLLFKDLKRTYFCGTYVILWDLIGIKLTKFSYLFFSARLLWRSTGQLTGPGVGSPSRSTDLHGTCTKASHSASRPTESTPPSGGGQSTGRSTVSFGPVDRAIDPRHNVIKMTVGRSTRQPTRRAFMPFPSCQWQILERL